ncbi:Inosine/uridine-preferring nucleoside hydrolase domain-containing protein [Schizophyllum amplum]|uniref:Inosine/uridine-preferring nucleoside hydrolase domain-containing protein n=1 Tax=Schizophyllum amplum TaxID=97359 RepID=A0A550CT20_9AGAR|nr:Inosine/uridine-preferring nucleoside hydrolase domain-containing protein [Auriculariopsis ampla]
MDSPARYIWLDCDPGHDDATAIMLALHIPNIHLLGISTTHGNTTHKYATSNAARCMQAFAPPNSPVRVHPGAEQPLVRAMRTDPEIHGEDGLGGVEGLPAHNAPEVDAWFACDADGNRVRALDGMARAVKETWNKGSGPKVTICSTGPMTNIAIFVSAYPDLLEGVEQFVFMGGGVGLGNRSSTAEYNIICDPHAAQIVLDAPVKAVMVPINVTHTALMTPKQHARLLNSKSTDPVPKAASSLRHTLSTAMTFFAATYKSVFDFDSPPLHDALTIAYVANPDLFYGKRYRVDVELTGTYTTGETVVDVYNYRECDDSWGAFGKNCFVTQGLDVEAFWDLFMDCVTRCDAVSSLNRPIST